MANIGELTATFNADIREWTAPLKRAQADVGNVTAATKAATAATREMSPALQRAYLGIRDGAAEAKESIRTVVRASSDLKGPTTAAAKALAAEQLALRNLTAAKAIFGVRARTAMTQIVGFTAAVSGATGPLGRMSQLLLSMGGGSLASLGAIAGLTAVAGAIGFLTKASRENAKSSKDATAALKEFLQTSDDVLNAHIDNRKKRLDELKVLTDVPLTGQERLSGRKSALRLALEAERHEIEELLAAVKRQQDELAKGTPTDRANLALEFSQASKETAKALELLRASEKELTEASSRANVPIKEQVQLLGALRRVQERLKDMAHMAPHKAFAAPWDMTTSAEEDIRRRNRLGSEWMEWLRKQARETAQIVKELSAPDVDVDRAMAGSPAQALFDTLEAAKEKRQELVAFMDSVGQNISRSLAHGILSGRQSVASALIDMFRMAVAELVAAVIKQKILDPLIRLIADAFGKGGGGGGVVWLPIGLPFPIPIPLPKFSQSPAMAAVGAGARSGPASLTVMVDTPPNPDPVAISRDAYHIRLWTEVARQADALGFRLRVERR